MRKIAIIATLLALTGCSVTAPVRGAMEDGSELFTGKATGYADATGTMQITSNQGLSCSGDWSYITSRMGRGVFMCSNGQSGPFEFVGNGTRGSGTGRLGSRRFTFTFG